MKIRTIRSFQKGHKIPEYIWDKIFEEVRFTPSSFDLQPWFFFVFESEFNKQKLKKCLIGNQEQLETSSAMVLLCGKLNKVDFSSKIYKNKLKNNEITMQQKKNILNQIQKYYNSLDKNIFKNELFLEIGIISLHFVLVSQKFGYNCCYIGGCYFNKLNSLFQIPSEYQPIILIAIGKKKKAKEDIKKKIKLKPEEFVKFL
ncbi:nitroreductase family protein [Candidatus Phytoplasma oryzae]|uniref:Nitroreductase n=1 Tax=Candidatus Phytoplasma oryzae TaxID=203274 RepID=A0A139JQ89_9MOLU|nr:nitroreductase family protein [Candidatus Phytoplasma oryzae]KXT29108.1 nitroreductase family protein [Candidatus Phytoplasma oryzae]RAM57820.1 nitroreductase [Candidatus Phytoplasma oryzae]